MVSYFIGEDKLPSKKLLYTEGKKRGLSIVRFNTGEIVDFLDSKDEDGLQSYLWECENNDRQFTPFESIAHNINRHEYPEEYWDEFEKGIQVGFNKGIKEIKKKL